MHALFLIAAFAFRAVLTRKLISPPPLALSGSGRFRQSAVLEHVGSREVLGWHGVLIEADPTNFQKLSLANRPKATRIHATVCDEFTHAIAITRWTDQGALTLGLLPGIGGQLETSLSRLTRTLAR